MDDPGKTDQRVQTSAGGAHTQHGNGLGRLNWKATIVLLALIVALFAAFIFYRVETWPARTARDVSRAFAEVAHLQPRITVRDRVFFEQTTSVLELAVVSRETQVEREVEHEWLGSKKKIKLRGVYHVKAGFDLTQPFSVRIDERTISTTLPPPRILSVDQQDIEVLVFENGIWNRIRAEDLEAEIRALPILARQKAAETGIQKEALSLFEKRLREKFTPQYEIDFRLNPGAPPSLP
jgi:hypothetical protein